MKAMRAIGAAALAGAMMAATPAVAGESEDFAGCDGLRKPKTKDDGMRGVASLPGYSFGAGVGPEATIAACTRALTGGKLLATQTLRQAHLLRARAAAKLKLGATQEALADLDLADTAIAPLRGEVFFDRSLGASLDLMRALALAQGGDVAKALPLAEKAAASRPYALPVQMSATMIQQAAQQADGKVAVDWGRLTRLQPELAAAIVSLEVSRGHYASAVAVARATPLYAPVLAKPQDGAQPFVALGQHGEALLDSARAGHDLAYALAATGDVAGARTALARAGDAYARLTGAAVIPGALAGNGSPRKDFFAPQARLVEARIALAEGRVTDAEGLTAEALPAGRPARDLELAIMRARNAGPPPIVSAETWRDPNLGALASTLLIAYESPEGVSYKKSRPNILGALVGAAFSMGTSLLSGIPKTSGFKETENADGTLTVEYDGHSSSAPMVQEMTLLRAAEIAKAAGKPGFAITARNDYSRWLTQTQYGVTLSRTPSGHKSELTIRLLDSDALVAEQGFATATVIDRLGPLYYETKPVTQTAPRRRG